MVLDPGGLIAWLLVGLVAGALASALTGNRAGSLGSLVLGLTGAFVGSFVSSLLGLGPLLGEQVGFFGSILVAFVGAESCSRSAGSSSGSSARLPRSRSMAPPQATRTVRHRRTEGE